jgi:4-diphosphocytidyl-2-C-methyl-D-erythritol kinase
MPQQLKARAYGKINLGLRIVGRRHDGFHDLRTVFQTIRLADDLEIARDRGRGITLELIEPSASERAAVPADDTNLAWRAAEAARDAFSLRGQIRIRLRKRIPVGAGLGGGSSDAAAVLLALARWSKRRVLFTDLLKLAGKLGSDVPPFLVGGTVLGLGRGDEVYPLPDLSPRWCVLARPPFQIGTAGAFRLWDRLQSMRRDPHTASHSPAKLTSTATSDRLYEFCSLVFQALPASPSYGDRGGTRGVFDGPVNPLKVRAGYENDFEAVVFPLSADFPRIQRLLAHGSEGSGLTGSGAAQFGLFKLRPAARRAAAILCGEVPGAEVWQTRTLSRAEYWRGR